MILKMYRWTYMAAPRGTVIWTSQRWVFHTEDFKFCLTINEAADDKFSIVTEGSKINFVDSWWEAWDIVFSEFSKFTSKV